MKKTLWMLAAIAALCVYAMPAPTLAEDWDDEPGMQDEADDAKPAKGKNKGNKANKAKADKPKKEKKQKADKPQKQKKVKPDALAGLAEYVGLTADQRDQIKAIQAETKAAQKQWETDNKERLTKLKEESKRARSDGSKELEKTAKAQMRSLNEEKAEIGKKGHERFLAVLTDEQKAKLTEYELYRGVTGSLKKAGLSESQLDQVKHLAGQSVASAEGKSSKALAGELKKKVVAEVLTVEQREALSTGKKNRGEGKAKADKPKNKRDKSQDGENFDEG